MPNEKTSIPCAVCRDLAPLVADGVASAESEALVCAHLEVCPACAAEWPELCAKENGPTMQICRKQCRCQMISGYCAGASQVYRRSALLLTAGALGGAL